MIKGFFIRQIINITNRNLFFIKNEGIENEKMVFQSKYREDLHNEYFPNVH